MSNENLEDRLNIIVSGLSMNNNNDALIGVATPDFGGVQEKATKESIQRAVEIIKQLDLGMDDEKARLRLNYLVDLEDHF